MLLGCLVSKVQPMCFVKNALWQDLPTWVELGVGCEIGCASWPARDPNQIPTMLRAEEICFILRLGCWLVPLTRHHHLRNTEEPPSFAPDGELHHHLPPSCDFWSWTAGTTKFSDSPAYRWPVIGLVRLYSHRYSTCGFPYLLPNHKAMHSVSKS